MAARHRALAGALACAVAMSVFGTAQAADSDGQALFKDNCNSCHGDGSPNGEYTPMTLIQDQWKRFFERKFERTHKDVMDPANGKTYKSKMELQPGGTKLDVSGCIMFICRAQTWVRE